MIGKYSDLMTYETILGNLLRRIPDTIDKREGSIIYDALSPIAAELANTYMELDVIMDETFVDTASLQYLMLRCKERGIQADEPTAATIQGTFAPSTLNLTTGMRFSCDDVNYAITDKIADGAYKLECDTAGIAGNKYSGFLLPVREVNGLQTASITGVLIPGEDGDTTETLRKKYYDSIDEQAFGGNIADYKEKVKSITGVGGVKVYPAWNGGGTVKLVVIASDFTVPSDELVNKVQTTIDPETNHGEGLGIAPIGHSVTVIGVTQLPITVQTNITFSSGWGWESSQNLIDGAVKTYFAELAESWEANETTIVRIAHIETNLLALDCVLDVADTTLNGNARNLEINANAIAYLQKIGAM